MQELFHGLLSNFILHLLISLGQPLLNVSALPGSSPAFKVSNWPKMDFLHHHPIQSGDSQLLCDTQIYWGLG